jgi:hypothetical protein
MENTRWSDIFTYLKEKGFDVYSPGSKEGECISPYIVVKHAGKSKVSNVSSSMVLYDLLVYIPKNRYSYLETFVNKVEDAMDGLFPMIRPVHYQTTPYYDDNVKGWMVSIQYENVRKNRRP